MVIRQVPFHQGARNSCSDEGIKYKHTCNLVGKVAKADYMLVWEHGGWGNSPLYRGVLREDITKKRILSSINKNRNLPLAGGREGKIHRAEVTCAKAQKHKTSLNRESSLVALKQGTVGNEAR